MDQDAPAKPREQKVSGQRTRWKTLLLILSLLHGSSMTPPHRRPHSRGLQAGPPSSRTHLFTADAHTASTPPCYWKNSLTDANALRGPRLVSGETGGAVTIRCHYAPSSVNRHQRKYWCRLSPLLWICYTIVSTNHYTHHDYRGRVTLTDFPQSGFFMVKLLQLSLNDTGLYRCGIGDRNDMLFFRTDLIVAAGPSNTTYAASSTSGELITTSPRIAAAANRGTPGVTQILEGQGSEQDRTALTTRVSKTTAPANGRQIPRTAKTTVPGTSSREEGSIKATVPTPESPTSKSRSMFSTTQGVWTWSTRNSAATRASTSKGREKGTAPEADGPQGETEVSTPPEALRKTTGTTRPSALISERVTWETLQEARETSKQETLYSVEESSPAPNAWTLNTSHTQMASGSIDWRLENTGGESSPQTPSQLSSGGVVWTPGKESSMKSALTGESSPWILTPVSTLLPLVLLAPLVLLKRRLWRQRTSPGAERPPRITLIQMTHFLPGEQPDVGKNLPQDDLPPAPAGLSVMEKDPEP
ncbi:high affinity immunoglobulin alpha and immunoglobulin mu Fc receptor [Phodopus roborovskii]|uniref:high affinity immunoglobulin alpha and immunoglobulin mu Fc receptor n=1 Tax=Phodopus roborovskii TaxID=109678 RepID=UPI0021E41D96|nr:high affinity immunoglobulin alpha and immunoglobulin mu Fc receptor [Phodopus roborovskii]